MVQDTLVKLGCRKELKKPRALHSGKESRVFWDVEQMYRVTPYKSRIAFMQDWFDRIVATGAQFYRGIPTGGMLIENDLQVYSNPHTLLGNVDREVGGKGRDVVILDDVMTTGMSVVGEMVMLSGKGFDVVAIAVLVNRSRKDSINSIPIISGFHADPVD